KQKPLLKIRENPDNDKLAKMLSELNAENGDFNAVFEKYFDEENYLTWCAINILFNNYDTMSRNFLLYSPSSSDKWYFLPWDYDASLIVEDKWKKNIYNAFFGIGRYWGTPLHKKYFLDPENVEKLTKKIDDVYKQLMQKPWSEIGKNYYDIALKKIFSSVDKEYFLSHQTIDGFIYDVNSFDKTITYYYNLFYQSLEKPMPIFLGKPTQNDDGTIQFNWSPSYDLQSDRIFYDFAVYTNIDDRENTAVFSDHLSVAKKNLSIDLLPDGIYYWDANPVDSKGNTQSGFDRLRIKEFETEKYSYFGIKRFKMVNGKIEFFE
ncbi:MAG: CotH kinase family protein, partial [Clostridia bacterium]